MNNIIVLPALRSTKSCDKSALKTHQQWRVQFMRKQNQEHGAILRVYLIQYSFKCCLGECNIPSVINCDQALHM